MSSALYRARLRTCPGCKATMRQVALRQMKGRGGVDLCDHCGGVFLEFFDGEPSSVSKELRQHLQKFASPLKIGGDPITCPDCDRIMEVHPYLDEGPQIARCNRCMALYATPEQVRALSNFSFIAEDETWFARLIALLRSIFAA